MYVHSAHDINNKKNWEWLNNWKLFISEYCCLAVVKIIQIYLILIHSWNSVIYKVYKNDFFKNKFL